MPFTKAMTEHVIKETIPAEQHIIDLQNVFNSNGVNKFLYLAYGETWHLAPPQLQSLLMEADLMDNGYQLSSWGRPRYREVLHRYIFEQNKLPSNCDWIVGWSSTGTRTKIYDFARLVKNAADSAPMLIFAAPSWDYQGVFGSLNYRMNSFSLSCENNFLPLIDDFHDCLKKYCSAGKNHNIVVVLNTQHNPTGVNWPEHLTKQYLQLALEYQTSILIDDAYFGVDSKSEPATSALRILFELSAGQLKQPWLAVRSLGKQFQCNGWGLGAVVGERAVMEKMGKLSYDHTYGYGGVWQSAMAKWLFMPESTDFISQFCQNLEDKKNYIKSFFSTQSDYPTKFLYNSTCSPYYLLKVPKIFHKDFYPNRSFLLDILNKHHLIVAPANMALLENDAHSDWIRLYLGPSMAIVEQACAKLAQYSWQ